MAFGRCGKVARPCKGTLLCKLSIFLLVYHRSSQDVSARAARDATLREQQRSKVIAVGQHARKLEQALKDPILSKELARSGGTLDDAKGRCGA